MSHYYASYEYKLQVWVPLYVTEIKRKYII
jgi:hypothetical protein